VRDLVGDDVRRIADFMLGVLEDESERTETRMQAASWLAERAFGRASQALDGSGESGPSVIKVVSVFGRDEARERLVTRLSEFVPTDVLNAALDDAENPFR
jgi:hypothetical protein